MLLLQCFVFLNFLLQVVEESCSVGTYEDEIILEIAVSIEDEVAILIGEPLTTLHLIGFYCYGLVLAAALVLSGMAVCSAIFGKERTMAALMPLPQDDKKDKKNNKKGKKGKKR